MPPQSPLFPRGGVWGHGRAASGRIQDDHGLLKGLSPGVKSARGIKGRALAGVDEAVIAAHGVHAEEMHMVSRGHMAQNGVLLAGLG